MKRKILSVDDHGIIAAGLETVARRIHGGTTVGSAQDSYEMGRMLQEEDWDLVVLDISLKGKSGLDVLKDLKQSHPKLPVLMFSLHTGVEFVRRALKNGASGYMSKDSPDTELAEAINTVLKGGRYVNKELRDELIFTAESGDHRDLSDREFEVLVRLGEGKTVKEIAAELNISDNTVDTYRSRVKEKMNMRRDAELIRYCIAANLVSVEIPSIENDPTDATENAGSSSL